MLSKRMSKNLKRALKVILSLVLAFSTMNLIYAKTSEATTTDTYESNGGQYQIGYILKNYNVFVKEDYTGTHVVGAVIAGGDVTLNGFGGISTHEETYPHGGSSYIGGRASILANTVLTGDKDLNLYLGTVNSDQEFLISYNREEGLYYSGNDHVYFTDDYIDKTKWDDLEEQAKEIVKTINIPKEDINEIANSGWWPEVTKGNLEEDGYFIQKGSGGTTITVKAGNSYGFETFENVGTLNIVGDDPTKDTIFTSNDDNSVKIPQVLGVAGGGENKAEGSSVVFVCPDALEVTAVGLIGHLVAPNADVSLSGGFFNGCVIAKSLKADAEGHMWPYNGEVLEPETEYGDLEIVKVTTGTTTPEDAKFTITGPNDYEKTVEYKEFTNGKYSIEDLETGTYTIKESNADVDGYTLTVTGEGTAVVKKDETTTATITNKYEEIKVEEKGALEIVKTSIGANTPDDATFTIKDSEGNVIKTLTYADIKAGNGIVNDLTVGEYTIEESNANVDNYTLNVTGDTKVTVEKDKTTTATITNTYTKHTGALKIVKTTKGSFTPDQTTFTVKDANGNVIKTLTYADIKSGNNIINNLPVGTYTVEEAGASVNGYTLTVTGEGTVTIAKDSTTTLSITNEYEEIVVEEEKGSLKINKDSKGATTPDDTVFEVKNAEGKVVASVTYNDIKAGNDTVKDLAVGTYTVEEKGADVSGYTVKVTGNKTVTVTKDSTATITLTNTYTRDTGDLEITKVTNHLTPADTEFKVTGDGYEEIFKYSEFTDGKLVVKGLPTGEYKVTEIKDTAEIANYTLTVDNDKTATVTKDSTVKVTITNTYKEIEKEVLGTLTIKKVTEGSTTPDDAVFTVSGPDGYSKTVKYSEFTDGEYTIKDLKLGTYTVVETGGDKDGYKLTVTVDKSATLTKEENSSVITVTNTYEEDKPDVPVQPDVPEDKAKLVIYKVDQDMKPLEGATFMLVKIVDGEEVEVKTIENGPEFVFDNLEDGEYKVYETVVPEGYEGITSFDIVIKDAEVYYDDELVTELTVMNTNDGTEPGVLGDEVEDNEEDVDIEENDDLDSDVQGDEKEVDTSDSQSTFNYVVASLLAAAGIYLLKKKRLFN